MSIDHTERQCIIHFLKSKEHSVDMGYLTENGFNKIKDVILPGYD